MHALGTGASIADALAEGVRTSAEGTTPVDPSLAEAPSPNEAQPVFVSEADEEAKAKRIEDTKPFVEAVDGAKQKLADEAEEAAKQAEESRAERKQDEADAADRSNKGGETRGAERAAEVKAMNAEKAAGKNK
jgi:hypothetical protein